MRKKFYIVFLLLLIPAAGFCGLSGSKITFEPKLSLTSAYGDTALQYFTYETPYKSAAAVIELPLYILISDNIYADINYFVRADYNISMTREDAGLFHAYNFQAAAVNYKNDLLSLKLGRQGYQSRNKNFVIYYGGYERRDNIAPTALDAVRHSLQTKYFSYDLLLGKEVKRLSFYDDDSLVYGATAGFSLGGLLGLDIFYYGRNTTVGPADYKITAYGAGAEFNVEDKINISLYAAKNSGEMTYSYTTPPIKTAMPGYGVNGAIKIPGENSFGKTQYNFNFYYGSPQRSNGMQYIAISQNMDRGYVFGGMDIIRYAAAPRQLSPDTPPRADITDIAAYSLTYSLDLDCPRYFSLGGGIYNFAATSGEFANNDLGSEIDLDITYKKGPLAMTAYYGLFISGRGLGEAVGLPGTPAGGQIQKFGLNFSFEFML